MFTDFNAWSSSTSRERASVARGEAIFNERALTITNVGGLNDNPAIGSPASIAGTCTTCHDTPNVGDHSVALALDIGTAHDVAHETDPQIASALAALSFPDVPVYEVDGCANGPLVTTDPGRALITGKCADVGRTKGPILRGLAARAPYFHNGSAASLEEVVEFYDRRFAMQLSDDEKADLVMFLRSL